MPRAVIQLVLFMALAVSPCAAAGAINGSSNAVGNGDDWNSHLRAVPANATRTRHYYRMATGEQFTGDAGLEALSAAGVAAGGEDDPVYSCTPPLTNNLLFVPGATRLIADDVTTVAVGGCDLDAFELVVGGGGDGSGPGFGIEFALYDGCPNGDGQPIPGTAGEMSFSDDGLHLLLIDFHDNPVQMDKSYYIAIMFDTDDSGWIAGVPASIGFTENQFDHPFFPCTARFPSETVYAGFYFAADCGPTEREFLAYRDADIFGFRLDLGDNNWIVDDIQLIGGIKDNTCFLSSYDVAGVGTGTVFNPVPFTITAELRTSCEPASVIQGTQRTFNAVGDGLAEVAQFEFLEPVQLPPGQNLFLAFKYSAPANVIVAGTPDLGFTLPTFTFEDGCGLIPCPQCLFVVGQEPVGFFANIRCLGNAPVGACCDLAGLSPAGDDSEADLCRNVKELTCRGTLSKYEPGAKCPGTCSDSFDRCQSDADCPGEAACEFASPFDPPCGFSACCKPPFPTPQDEECEDMRKVDCLALYDDYECVDSQGNPGTVCGGDGEPCTTDDDCPDSTSCESKKCITDAHCNACANSGDQCQTDEDCAKTCSRKFCSYSFSACMADDDCPDGEQCVIRSCTSNEDCFGVCSISGFSCQSDDHCPPPDYCEISTCETAEECVLSGDTCEPGDGAHQAIWQTAQVCFEGAQNCVHWVCRLASGNCDEIHATLGCSAALCCDQVCNVDPFCCAVEWDGACVQRANGDDPNTSACALFASNDHCWVSRECSDESGLCETVADCNRCVDSGLPCMVDDDCRACISTGAPCQVDGDCIDGMCAPSEETCFLSGATCQESPRGARRLNTCSGVCSSVVRACESDNDCNHCSVTTGVHCNNVLDCPFLQNCIQTATCEVDDPRRPCETDTDCDEAGAECVARSGPLGVFMPVDAATTGLDERLCCHPVFPGLGAFGSVWAKFIATETSAQLSTCPSNAESATDSIIEVYRTDFDKECSDTSEPCVADGDCPDGVCERSNRVACQTRVPIACNDNALIGCSEPNNSRLCVSNLEIGATYLVQVAAMTPAAIDRYSLSLESPCPGIVPTPPANDHCENAAAVVEGEWPYDLAGATMDCPYVSFDCLPPSGDPENPYRMTNDVWFDYVATLTGPVTIQTCEGSPEATPDTTLVVYDGLDCPVTFERQVVGGCNDDAEDSECGGGSWVRFDVVASDSYRIRVGGKQGSEPSGLLTINVESDCQFDSTVIFLNPDGAPDGDWYDARQPHLPYHPGFLFGRDTFTVMAPVGADQDSGICWELCETNNNPSLHAGLAPNSISDVYDLGGGMYDIVLARPIAQGEVTRLRYSATGDTAWFRYLPGDVNRDGASAAADILAVIDCLNGVAGFACNLSNTDVDRSNQTGPPDILRVIDLLNGASGFETWLDTQLDLAGCE